MLESCVQPTLLDVPFKGPDGEKVSHEASSNETELFCSGSCRARFFGKRNGASLRRQLFDLERGVCQQCGFDCHDLWQNLLTSSPERRKKKLEDWNLDMSFPKMDSHSFWAQRWMRFSVFVSICHHIQWILWSSHNLTSRLQVFPKYFKFCKLEVAREILEILGKYWEILKKMRYLCVFFFLHLKYLCGLPGACAWDQITLQGNGGFFMASRSCCARVARRWTMWPWKSTDLMYCMP